MNGSNNGYDCPVCGEKKRRRAKDLVCHDCYKNYTQMAGKALANGEVIRFTQWVETKTGERLALLRTELEEKQKAYKALQEEVAQEAFKQIKASLNGGGVPREVFTRALHRKRQELWQKKGGNRLHFETKTLEKQVSFAEGVVASLREKARRPSEDNTEIEV